MELSKKERLMLSNQFSILASLNPEEADYYKKAQEIVEQGYTLDYSELFQNIDDPITEEQCKEVLDILVMFNELAYWHEKLGSKISERDISFIGFDDHSSIEVKYLIYTRFLLSQEGRFERLVDRSDKLLSHMPTLDVYRRMLSEWKAVSNKFQLKKTDLKKITEARIHPSQRKNS